MVCFNFISAVLGHLRCCLTSNPILTLFLCFLDEEAIKRWQQNKAQSKESQMTKMVPVEGKKQLIILRCSSCFDLEAEKKAKSIPRRRAY